MAYSKSQKRATMKWDAENYDQIKFTAPKGFNVRLAESAKLAGKSKRQFIIEALEKAMGEEAEGKKLFWVNFIMNCERPCLLSISHPYLTLKSANDSVQKTLKSYDVILTYIQEQDTKTGKLTPVLVTPHIDSLGMKKPTS